MKFKKTLCALTALAFLTACSPGSLRKDDKTITVKQAAKELKNKDIVYFGETHDSKYVHEQQLDLFKELYKQNQDFNVGLEMIQKDYQPVLDEYLRTKMTEDQLKTKLNWEKTWGHDFEFFRPIFKFAKEKNLDIIALNAPRSIVKKVVRQGLESLTEEDYKYVPKEFYQDEEEYEQLKEIFKNHPGMGGEEFYKKMYDAQTLWNETMAATIIDYIKKENKHLLVIAGDGHISLKIAIPGRVEKRAEKEGMEIETSIISVSQGDYVLVLPKK